MAVASETLSRAETYDMKGKAAYVLHTWKDFLWDLGNGKKAEVPAPIPAQTEPEAATSPAGDATPQSEGAGDIDGGDDHAAEEHEENGSKNTDAIGTEAPPPNVGTTGYENEVSQSVPMLSPDGECKGCPRISCQHSPRLHQMHPHASAVRYCKPLPPHYLLCHHLLFPSLLQYFGPRTFYPLVRYCS